MNLALKYRPRRFTEVIGQDESVSVLRTIATSRTDLRVVLLAGPAGTGKTTQARLYGGRLNCEDTSSLDLCLECPSCKALMNGRHPDIDERDCGSRGLVSDMRKLKDEALMKPSWKFRVFLLDEIHAASKEAFNSLLKVLEEPPEQAAFVMLTTELYRVPYPIRSRSLLLELQPIGLESMVIRLAEVCRAEGIEVESPVLKAIAEHAGGSMRDAYMVLQRLQLAGEGPIDNDKLQKEAWFAHKTRCAEFIKAILKLDKQAFWNASRDLGGRLQYEALVRTALDDLSRAHKGFILQATCRVFVGRSSDDIVD